MTRETVTCSRCGGGELLQVVTMLYNERVEAKESSGRLMVYCWTCRRDRIGNVDVFIPLPMFTSDMFVDLYRLGRTGSAPESATEIIFGEEQPELAERARQASIDAGWTFLTTG